MSGKRVAIISLSALALAGGTFALVRNRKRAKTYNAILGKILQNSPIQNANYVEYFDPSFHKSYDPNKYRKYTTLEARQVADSLRSSMYGEWYQLGMGTDEDSMFATLSQIPDGVRLSQVSEQYVKKYEEPLFGAIQSELDLEEQNQVVSIVSRKKVSSPI
jgi:hypothetical protein